MTIPLKRHKIRDDKIVTKVKFVVNSLATKGKTPSRTLILLIKQNNSINNNINKIQSNENSLSRRRRKYPRYSQIES